jgi:hypothetical protein
MWLLGSSVAGCCVVFIRGGYYPASRLGASIVFLALLVFFDKQIIMAYSQYTIPGSEKLVDSYDWVMSGKAPRNDYDKATKKNWTAYLEYSRKPGSPNIPEDQLKGMFMNDLLSEIAWSMDAGPEGKSAKQRRAEKSGGGMPLGPLSSKLQQFRKL